MTLFASTTSTGVDKEPADLPPESTNAVIEYWELRGRCPQKLSEGAVR